MGSRRTMSRSTSWNGRSTNGDNNNGSNRPGGYSYLSNVRPENRSTLCSVMAQLTEETQPSFETTLKSKAVSENCNVKFTCVVKGYPTPQVIWYKDDKQLDRFCGLPKYEIFRNGPNHSLHIYNCTVEDAAIYQASAINGKGIVSCSGVLEVGEMNEFNIHQRYFSKLKQKAEHKRREAEGKENQEPLRTISPDRTQRKRRSTMEAFLSTPSSMEDEGNEESHHAVAVEAEARLQEPKVEEVEEKPVSVTNRAVSTISNGQAVNENANKGGTYIYDTAQKVFTAHQPKTPFVKKKIKISNSTKVAKADVSGERSKDETSTDSGFLVSVESVESKKKSEEVMKVEKIVSSSVVNSDSRKVKEQHQKPETQEAHRVERSSNDKNICVVPSQREQLTAPVSPTHLTSAGHNESGTDGKHENEAGLKDTAEIMEIQTQSPYNLNLTITSTQLESSVPSTLPNMLKKDTIKTQDVTAMDVDEKSDVSTLRDLRSVDVACESRTALPQRPCELTGDQRSEKETSSCQKTVSETGPALLREVTQAHTKINRNDAPVTLELSDNQCMMDAQPPQKTPSERETATRDVQTQSLHHGHQAAIDKMIQDTWGHSSKSYERHTDLFKDQKSALERPGGAENSQECKVSSTAPQSQVQPAIKTPQGTETQADKEVGDFTVDTLSVDIDGVTSNDKILKMETETAVLQLSVQIKTETRDAADKDTDVVAVETLCKEKIEPVLKMSEKSSSEMQKLKKESASDQTGTDVRHLSTSENNLEEIIRINEVSKPASKVISVAELLRSQIKVLDITLANSVPVIPIQDFLQEPKTTTETCQEFRNDGGKCREEVKGLIPDLKTETNTNNTPPHSSIKSTLMELYNQLNKADQDLTQPALPVHALQKPPVTETKGLCDVNVKKYSGGVMDVGQETGAPGLVPLINCPTSPTESENVKALPSSSSNDEPTTRPTFISLTSGLVRQTSGSPLTARTHDTKMTTLENEPVQVKDIDLIQTLTSEVKLNSKTETRTTGSLQTPSSPDTQGNNLHLSQQGGSTAVDSSPTLEVSPRLKERNCVSPIPSATPQELASGARRKILLPKAKQEVTEATSPADNQAPKKDVAMQSSKLPTSPMTPSVSPSLSRRSPLLQPTGDLTPTGENRSPLLSRRQTTFETQVSNQQQTEVTKPEDKPKEKDPFKAPQVIRKIRAETYADTSGHLKVWCQFFNVLSDSTIKWFKNEEEISQIKRTAGDETQVNLAIVQASSCDSGVYGCSITNEYGSDSTDTLLSSDILAGMSLSEDLGVGEEIELTPMIFSRGVADSGIWGNKLFGRIMMQESHIGEGWSHKVWRAKVIYGLEPVFDSGNTCIIKVRNPIAYGGKGESCLIERNLEIIKQNCKIQNLAREYCKIFSTEARVIESFGPSLEVVPVYLMYRPANTVPYATVEADLTGVYQKYSNLDHTGRLDVKTGSGVEQKCCALQHWIFQWTNGNLLLTRLEGVDTKITNVGISVKSTGYQGLSLEGNPKVFEQFVSQHQCNYYCGLLGLRSLKIMDSLLVPTKPKGSKSPLLQRKMAAGSSSPQTGRKAAGSPRLPRKTEQDGRNTPTKQKPADAQKVVKMA